MKICELGEIDLLSRFVLDKLSTTESDYNNDCVSLGIGGETLLWSIDPCPTPVAFNIGYSSPEILGWYTAIINISDIAACGGSPEGFLVSVELPDNTDVEYYERFNIGLSRALESFETKFLGGNLKAAAKFSATGTIIGKVQGKPLTRLNTNVGDKIVVIGQSGLFWAGVLQKLYDKAHLSPGQLQELEEAVCYPKPNVAGGRVLKELSDGISCMDCSDGVINCCFQFAKLNDVSIEIDKNIDWPISDYVLEIYAENGVDVDNACTVFGDWQLVCSVNASILGSLKDKLSDEGIPFAIIGEVTVDGFGLCRGGLKVNPVHINQNFSGGYNSIKTIHELIDKFMYTPLFIESVGED